jgi:hypothetical protein
MTHTMTPTESTSQSDLDSTLVTFIHQMSCLGWALTKLRFTAGYDIHFASLTNKGHKVSYHVDIHQHGTDMARAQLGQWIADAERPKR